jgi:uncharacterized protein (TIGR02466 family)
MSDELNLELLFSSPIYFADKPEFLEIVKEVSSEYLEKTKSEKTLDEIYPVYMTNNYFSDPRIADFVNFVGQSAWRFLDAQGYDMHNFSLSFSEMWTQEHYKHSAMEQHTHPNSHVVGFYFLEIPDESSRAVFHDPRTGKIMTDLPQKDQSIATMASQMINYMPRPGLIIFAPAWLAHSFTRHGSDNPIQFVHFNLYAQFAPHHSCDIPAAEVI